MSWFPLALICALSLASADVLIKRGFPDGTGVELLVVRFVVTAAVLVPVAAWQPFPEVPAVFWGWLLLLVPLELAAMLLYMVAIRDHPLHMTLPYLAFTPVFNVITGYTVLGESSSAGGMAGILLVVAGGYLLNLHGLSGWRSCVAPLTGMVRERGSRLMLGAAAIYSLTSVGSKAAMGYTTPWIFGPFYYVLIGATLLVVLAVASPASFSVVYRRPILCMAVGVLMGAMVITHFVAIARVEVAYFISVKRTSLLFGIVYGALFFGERDLVRNLAGGALMVVGVALIVGRSTL